MATFVNFKIIRSTFMFLLAIVESLQSNSQSISITGPTCVVPGTQYHYIISGNWSGSMYMQWCVSGGTITGYGQCASGAPLPGIYVAWSAGGTHNITLYTSNPSGNTSKDVYENIAFNPGSITGNPTQTVSANSTPATITCSAAVGGNCGPVNYIYQWEQSPDNVSFTNFPNGTMQDLSFPGPLGHSTYFRRRVTETVSNTLGYSDVAVVFVDPLNGGQITSGNQYIVYNTIPSTVFATAASAGTCGGNYIYEWQRSTDNVSFSSFGAPASQNLLLTSPATQTYYYRRQTSCAGETKYTGTIKISVTTFPGTLSGSQVITNGSVAAFNLAGVAGGDCNGSYSYQWQQSYNEIDWIPVSNGPNALTYTATLPETFMYYRVGVSCGAETVYSNSVRLKNAIITTNIPNNSTSISFLTPTVMPGYPAGTDPNNINYIRVRTISKPGIFTIATAGALTDKFDVSQSTEYFDGLGRSVQSVVKNATPLGNDMVIVSFYDPAGRIAQKYLPYTDNLASGNFRVNASTQQPSFYNSYFNNTESFYYSNTRYEASPLNTVLQQTSAGKSWTGSGRGTRIQARSNTLADDVKIWTIGYAAGSLPQLSGIYNDGQLLVSITSDEQDNKVIEYKNIEGQLVLKKNQLADVNQDSYTGWLCTYYIYDEFNLLRFVIQPRAVEWLTSNGWSFATSGGIQVADELCFRYEYDQRRRMVVKKLPGAGEVWMVYDARDRLVMTQDAKLRTQTTKQWMVLEYDELNRPLRSGLWNDANDRPYHQSNAYSSSNYPHPIAGYEVLTETYYDDYTFPGVKTYDPSYANYLQAGNNHYPEAITRMAVPRGLTTGAKTKVLGTSQYLFNTTYYDNKARPAQSLADNITNSVDVTTSQYNFGGKLLSTYLHHKINSLSYSVLTKLLYDHAGRILETRKVFNSGPEVLIAANSFDELGQMNTKRLGQKTDMSFLESLDYKYNIRNWLTGINRGYVNPSYASEASLQANRWFGMELNYDYGFSKLTFNGNVSGTRWRSKGDGAQRAYGFYYDNVNRLLKADFTQYTSSSWNTNAGIDFSMGGDPLTGGVMKYDANGNITAMWQTGLKLNSSAIIDKLSYSYKNYDYSNQLMKVSDGNTETDNGKLGDFKDGSNGTANDFTYDINGNLSLDNNKNIGSITYNYLNLPALITVLGKGTITYTYDAIGVKQKKTVQEDNASITYNGTTYNNVTAITTTTYLSGFVYETRTYNNPALNALQYTDKLQFAYQEEGRIRPLYNSQSNPNSITGFAYDYFIRDHLGNVRMVLTDEVRQDVYPAATLENTVYNGGTAVSIESNFYTVDDTRVVNQSAAANIPAYQNNNGNPPYNNNQYSNYTAGSSRLYLLNAAKNTMVGKVGLGIVAKVMAGDNVNIFGKSYHIRPGTGYTLSTYGIAVSQLIEAFVHVPLVYSKGVSASQIIGAGFPTSINALIGNQPGQTSNTPKAAICWIMFDEQFKYVGGGFDPVGTALDSKGTFKNHDLSTIPAIPISKNGYIYVYCSNESAYDVFFDNLQLIHNRGPLIEETHYYPFGLTMAGISSKALNFGSPGNNQKFNGLEETTELGLDQYDAVYRNLDPQIGRWWQPDPKSEDMNMWSTYVAMLNNPIKLSDSKGDEPDYRTTEAISSAMAVENWDQYFRDRDPQYLGQDLHQKQSGIVSSTSTRYTYELWEYDPITDNDWYGTVSFMITSVLYDNESIKFVVTTATANEIGVGSNISVQVDREFGTVSGNFSFSSGNETISVSTGHVSSGEMSIGVPVNGVTVGAKAGMSQSETFTTGKVLNGEKQEFMLQLAYDSKTNQFLEISMPTKSELKEGATRMKDASTFPSDGWFGGSRDLFFKTTKMVITNRQ